MLKNWRAEVGGWLVLSACLMQWRGDLIGPFTTTLFWVSLVSGLAILYTVKPPAPPEKQIDDDPPKKQIVDPPVRQVSSRERWRRLVIMLAVMSVVILALIGFVLLNAPRPR